MALDELTGLASKIAGNTKNVTHSFGATQTDRGDLPSAAQVNITPPTGPTGFWDRIGQIGIGKVNLLNAAKIAKSTGESIVSPATGLAKDVNNKLLKPAVSDVKEIYHHPSELLRGRPDQKYSRLYDEAVKSGKVKAPGKFIQVGQKVDLGKALANGGGQKGVNDAFQKSQAQKNKDAGRMVAEGVGTAALVYGGGETKAVIEDAAKGATKKILGDVGKNAVAGAVANEAGTLQRNPNASGREQLKSTIEGGVFGAATTVLGAVGGKVLGDVKTILNKNPEISNLLKNAAASKLLQKGQDLNRPVKIGVEDTGKGAEKIGVKTPVRAGVKEISETNKINVRTPDQMSGKEYVQRLVKIGKSYDSASSKLEGLAPAAQKVKQDIIDKQHQKAVADLNDEFNKPPLTKAIAPKKIASKISPAEKTTGGLLSESKPKLKAIDETPKVSLTKEPKVNLKPTEGEQVSGSALKTRAQAVEAGMKADAEATGAKYDPVSSKNNSMKATELVQKDPTKARDIALGRVRGENTDYESAVYHAYKDKVLSDAHKTGDFSEAFPLMDSPHHTNVSEFAQGLHAEAYHGNTANDPIGIMRQIADTRAAVAQKSLKQPIKVAVTKTAKEIDDHIKPPSKANWQMFVESIKC